MSGYHVATMEGKKIDNGVAEGNKIRPRTEDEAKVRCGKANNAAKELGIKTRYQVVPAIG